MSRNRKRKAPTTATARKDVQGDGTTADIPGQVKGIMEVVGAKKK